MKLTVQLGSEGTFEIEQPNAGGILIFTLIKVEAKSV